MDQCVTTVDSYGYDDQYWIAVLLCAGCSISNVTSYYETLCVFGFVRVEFSWFCRGLVEDKLSDYFFGASGRPGRRRAQNRQKTSFCLCPEISKIILKSQISVIFQNIQDHFFYWT